VHAALRLFAEYVGTRVLDQFNAWQREVLRRRYAFYAEVGRGMCALDAAEDRMR
jgi:hypothetical protein